jgi:hypothetical protein
MIDARTIQNLIDREEARRKGTPVLSLAALDQAIAQTKPQPAGSDDAASIHDAVAVAVTAGREIGRREGRAAGQQEGIQAGIAASQALGRVIERNK